MRQASRRDPGPRLTSEPPFEPRLANAARHHSRVTLHFAQSLDGRIATRSGLARWISGPRATRFAHQLRASSDAVIIGSGTALADDPLLTVRHVRGPQPLRVILDARGRLPNSAKLATDRTAPTLHVTHREAVSTLPGHVERWELPAGQEGEGVDLSALLARLVERGAHDVLVEGGGRVITAFLRQRLVDRIVLTVAPIILGSGVEAVGDLRTDTLEQALRFQTRRVWRLDSDVMIELSKEEDGSAP